MANIKITQLAATTDPASTDVLPIIDVSADTTNKVSVADLLESAGDGTASAPGISFDSDSDTGIYRVAANELGISTGGTHRVVVDSAGSVGIGTTNPSRKLQVSDSNESPVLVTTSAQTCNIRFGNATSSTGSSQPKFGTAGDAFVFSSGNTGRLRIDSNGNVGIGTSTPASTLTVVGDVNISGAANKFIGPTAGQGSSAAAPTYSFSGQNTGMFLAGSNTLAFSTDATERLRITSAGNVGIGTVSPGGNLHVQGAAGDAARIYLTDGDATGTANSALIVKSGTRTEIRDRQTGSSLAFFTEDTEKVRISSDGNVGIGATAPNRKLTIVDSNPVIRLQDSDGTNQLTEIISATGASYYDSRNNTVGGPHIFRTWNGSSQQERMRIDRDGNVGIGTGSPTEKLHLSSDAAHEILLERTGANPSEVIFGNVGQTALISNNTNGVAFNIGSTPTERMRINSGGNVGIGVSAPEFALDLRDGAYATNQNFGIQLGVPSDQWKAGLKIKSTSAGVPRVAFDVMSDNSGSTIETLSLPGGSSAGRVGIGTTAPGQKLDVVDSADSVVRIKTTGTGSANDAILALSLSGTTASNYINFGDADDANAGEIRYNHSDDSLRITANAAERLRIASSGNVGIGTTAPSSKLHVTDNTLGITAGDTKQLFRLNTTTLNGDSLIFEAIRNTNGTDWTTAGHRIRRLVDTTNMGYIQFGSNAADLITFGEGSNEYLRIDGTGKVGIGTDAPAGILHLSSATTTRFAIEGNDGRSEIRASNGNLSFFANQSANVSGVNNTIFYRNGSNESMRINASGFVGIGTTTPQRPIHVKNSNPAIRLQDADGTSQTLEIIHQGSGTYYDSRNNTAGGIHIFRSFNGTTQQERLRIEADGNVGIGTATPGEKLEVNGTIKATDINFTGLSTFADDSAAGTGGLAAGDVYKTSTGELRIKL